MEVKNPSRIRVLIIANNDTLRSNLHRFIRQLGYQTTTTDDDETAIDLLKHAPGYDLAILDLFLSERAGWNVLEALNHSPADAACLVLSARADLDDRLRCFRLGADDVVEKPFHLQELQARMEAILRRKLHTAQSPDNVFTVGDLAVDLTADVCYRRGEHIPLTAVEFKLLKYLIQNRERAVSREELADKLWSDAQSISLRTIDRHIATIRQKLEDDPSMPEYVQTIYGEGYRFMPDS